MVSRVLGVALVASATLVACAREHDAAVTTPLDARPPEDAATPPDAPPFDGGGAVAPGRAPAGEVPVTWLEARRARVTRVDDEPALARNEATLRAHFGGALPSALRLQAVPLAQGDSVVLVEADEGDSRPIVLYVDATGAALWTKDRPLAGIRPPATQLALAPRPENGVALFLFDEPTHLVAARMWDAEGFPFADLQLFDLPRCDALSVAWWPARGWVVVATHAGAARAQLLATDGSPAWGKTGIDVGEPWRAGPAPATLAIDDASEDDAWWLVQYATRAESDHVVAARFDRLGNTLWRHPIDLGRVDPPPPAGARVRVSIPSPGVARIVVGSRVLDLLGDGGVSSVR